VFIGYENEDQKHLGPVSADTGVHLPESGVNNLFIFLRWIWLV
jgi:hypothetical protein